MRFILCLHSHRFLRKMEFEINIFHGGAHLPRMEIKSFWDPDNLDFNFRQVGHFLEVWREVCGGEESNNLISTRSQHRQESDDDDDEEHAFTHQKLNQIDFPNQIFVADNVKRIDRHVVDKYTLVVMRGVMWLNQSFSILYKYRTLSTCA